jgi:hypothetical protein
MKPGTKETNLKGKAVMTQSFWSKSLDISNIPENRQDQFGAWLRRHRISHQFNAQSGSFTYVKLDETTAANLKKDFPEAQLAASAPAVEIKW